MKEFNDIGISRELDLPRIRKLLSIGVFASLLHLVGCMILGWGAEDESAAGLLRILSAYAETSDGGILAAGLLGLFGMTLEGLSLFGIYRLMAGQSPRYAHSYRTGIFGYLMFGACGLHLPVCALALLMKHGVEGELLRTYAGYFLLPAALLFLIFFLVGEIAKLKAFLEGKTPYPAWCAVFCIPTGILLAAIVKLFGNFPFVNALFLSGLALGNLLTFAALLILLKRVEKNS